jgi:hypothetical protein
MPNAPRRGTAGTHRWGSVAPRGRLRRTCPKCGAPPFSSCVKVRTLKVTGQDMTLPDPTYEIRLKTPHPER